MKVRGAERLATSLREGRQDAALFKDLATLRTSADVGRSPQEWKWEGPRPEFTKLCHNLRAGSLAERAQRLAEKL